MVKQSQEELLQQIKDLKNRLDESEQLIEAIKAGEVDAFAINNESGAEVYALQSGDYAYRVLIEELEESALNVTEEGLIVYTNPHFCNFLQLPYEKVIGTNIKDFVYTNSKAEFSKLLSQSVTGKSNGEINLTVNNKIVQVYISFTSLLPKLSTTGILITDLTEKIRTKQIEESEKQLSRMANAMPQLVWIADANGKVIYYNERVSEYAGANKTENEKWLWNELIYAEDFKATKEAWTEAISNEVIYEIQHRIQMKDGTYRWHLSRGMPQRNELGKIISWYGTATDIDQQKIAEEQIRESEERFRFALKAGHLGSWELDLETLDMKSSEGCKANFGQPVNLPFSYQTLRDSIHDDDKDRMLSVVAQTIDTGEDYDIEYRVVWPDKSLHWVNIRGQLRRSEKGEPVSMVGVSLDITERKKAEEILSESEERFRTLAETLPSLVWMTDEKGKQLYISERWEQYAGVKPDETNWTQILHPDDIEHTGKEWVHSLQTGKSYHTEVRLKNKDNQYNWYYGVGEPLCNNDNKIIRWIGAFTDIHEQKIFAEKLEHEVENRTNELLKKNKELESFSYIASHDLQEPLRKIQTFINLLHKHKEDANALEKYLVKIQDAAQRMSKLIQNVLEYSRISKSGDALVPTDLNIVLKNVKSDYELLIEERNATIISETLPVINAIPLQIHQLFANLISNAIKFSDKQPEIKITCEIVFRKHIPRDLINTNSLQNFDPNEKITILKFSDNGVGFDQQYSEKIFQLFQRLHAKAEYPGTGIGLSIVKKIVEEHNGFITATSAEGKGTTFTNWLPGFIQDA